MKKNWLFSLILILITPPVTAEINFNDHQWQLKKELKNIEIFTANAPDTKFISVLGKTTIKTSLSSLLALVLDASACSEWVYLCESSQIHQQISDTELYLYTATNLPWPVKDRDILVHIKISQNPKDLSVAVKAIAKPNVYPLQENYLRITESTSIWKFIPLNNGTIQIEVYSNVNPAGAIPTWLSNRLITKTPYISLKNMRALVQSGKYDNKRIPYHYIKEPLN